MERKSVNPIILSTDAGLFLTAILIVLLLVLTTGCGSSTSDKDTEKNINARLKRLETRLAAIEVDNTTCGKQNAKAKALMADIERRQAALTVSISKLEEQLKAGMAKAGKVPVAANTESAAPKKDSQPPTMVEDSALSQPRYHHVQKGETVYSISHLYNLEPAELRKMNGSELDVIVPGQKLRVK